MVASGPLGTITQAHLDSAFATNPFAPIHLARWVVEKARPEAAYLTGAVLAVDGGGSVTEVKISELARRTLLFADCRDEDLPRHAACPSAVDLARSRLATVLADDERHLAGAG
jgi:hypothetical protein